LLQSRCTLQIFRHALLLVHQAFTFMRVLYLHRQSSSSVSLSVIKTSQNVGFLSMSNYIAECQLYGIRLSSLTIRILAIYILSVVYICSASIFYWVSIFIFGVYISSKSIFCSVIYIYWGIYFFIVSIFLSDDAHYFY